MVASKSLLNKLLLVLLFSVQCLTADIDLKGSKQSLIGNLEVPNTLKSLSDQSLTADEILTAATLESNPIMAAVLFKVVLGLQKGAVPGTLIPGVSDYKFLDGAFTMTVDTLNITDFDFDDIDDTVQSKLTLVAENQIQIKFFPMDFTMQANYSYVDEAGTTQGLMTISGKQTVIKADITTYDSEIPIDQNNIKIKDLTLDFDADTIDFDFTAGTIIKTLGLAVFKDFIINEIFVAEAKVQIKDPNYANFTDYTFNLEDLLTLAGYNGTFPVDEVANPTTLTLNLGFANPIQFPQQKAPLDTTKKYIRAQAKIGVKVNGVSPPADLFQNDMSDQSHVGAFTSLVLNHNALNQLTWAVMESGILKLQVNQASLTALEFGLATADTEGLKILFPGLSKKYPTKSSVILMIRTPKYSPTKSYFRNVQGRLGILATIMIDMYVYEGVVDPNMTIGKCGNKCVKAVTLETQYHALTGIATNDGASLTFSYLDFDINYLTVSDPTFDVDQVGLYQSVKALAAVKVPSSLADIFQIPLVLFKVTIDLSSDQRLFAEISNIES